MKVDFPDNERKPLAMITKGMDQGSYECLGMVEDGESREGSDADICEGILCYSVFVKNGNAYLFDYLAAMGDIRNKGFGTQMLGLLKEYYKDADCVFGEVENPEYAKKEEDKEL